MFRKFIINQLYALDLCSLYNTSNYFKAFSQRGLCNNTTGYFIKYLTRVQKGLNPAKHFNAMKS